MGYFQVRYDSGVVIYERKMFIGLATVANVSVFRVVNSATESSRILENTCKCQQIIENLLKWCC